MVHNPRLLGLIIQSDCKWNGNTKFLVDKAKKRIWFLRGLKLLGAPVNMLIDMFKLYIRFLLEMGAPLYAGALTKKISNI